jgi:hypothetical protein
VEILSLWVILGCVYLSETLWWTTQHRILLTGSRRGDFRARRGPSIDVRDGKGFFFTWPLPPFLYAFECSLSAEPAATSKRVKRTELEKHVAQVLSLAAPLRLLGEGLWLYLFAIVPAAVAMLGLLVVWLPLVVILLLWLTAIVIMFRRSWLRLHSGKPSGWRPDATLMVLSPLGATRAADRLTRSAFADVSGLHLASVLATPDEFCRLARQLYFDDESPAHGAVKAEVDRILESMRLRPTFEAPPAREGGMLGFCPRCHTQVMRASGTCPDCVDRPIVPFEGDEMPADLKLAQQ